jgi:GTPase
MQLATCQNSEKQMLKMLRNKTEEETKLIHQNVELQQNLNSEMKKVDELICQMKERGQEAHEIKANYLL